MPSLLDDKFLSYYIDGKQLIDLHSPSISSFSCDIFISAYNDSDRVKIPFQNIVAKNKFWFSLNEYGYDPCEIPGTGQACCCKNYDEDCIEELFDKIDPQLLKTGSVCIDITGFMRPHILYMMIYLLSKQISNFFMIYTEPKHYYKKADTEFSMSDVAAVRPVMGFSGVYDVNMSNDVLVVGVGYDHDLIARVIECQTSSRVLQLLSLPSLSADMYQESLLRLSRVSNAQKIPPDRTYFSSANDPFVTAQVLSEIYHNETKHKRISNFYLCPLATKPQTLGFGLFFLKELQDSNASIIFPFAAKYNRETGKGLGRSWLYEIVL